MTIAVGFTCVDGLMLLADTEVSMSTMKVSGQKFRIGGYSSGVHFVLIGAGSSDMSDLAYENIQARLPGIASLAEGKLAVSEVIQDIWERYLFPDPKAAQRSFDVMVGLWAPEDAPRTLLLKSSRNVVVEVPTFDALGTGWELAASQFARYYRKGIAIQRGVPLAVQVLRETKKYVQNCGGESHVVAVRGIDGACIPLAQGDIEFIERYQEGFDGAVNQLLLDGQDVTVDGDTYCRLIEKAALTLQNLRSNEFIRQQREVFEEANAKREDSKD